MRPQEPTSSALQGGPTARAEVGEVVPEQSTVAGVSRRTILRLGAVGGAGVALVTAQGIGLPFLSQKGLLSADGAFAATSTALGDNLFYVEVFPTSPLILSPFTDELVDGQRAASDLAGPDRLS